MKRKLIFAMLCIVSVLGLRAQLTDGTVYWIQDASTGQFISQGGNWATQATVKDVGGIGFEAQFISDGVYKLNNIQFNKANNRADDAKLGLRNDCYTDQTSSNWTLTVSGDGYKVSSDGKYLCNNGTAYTYGGNVKWLGTTTNESQATVWKFLTKTQYDAALQAKKDARAAEIAAIMGVDGITTLSAFETELAKEDYVRVDQTSKITNAALSSGNINGWTSVTPFNSQRTYGVGSENGTCAEAWNCCGVLRQTVSGLPNGLYKLTLLGVFRPKGSDDAKRLTSEQTSSPAFFYANDDKIEAIHWIDAQAANNRTGIVNNAATYTHTIYTYVTDGSLTIGAVQDAWYSGYEWFPFGRFTLTQIYSVASYKKAYDDAMAAATAAQTSLTGFSVYATKKATLDDAITDNTLTGSDLTDVDKLTASATALNAAAAAVAAEKAACDQYASIVSTIGSGSNVDLTAYVNNASFETGDLTSWTSGGDGAGHTATANWDVGKVGTYFVERWVANGTSQNHLSDGSLTHDGIVLPAGIYVISARGQNQEQKNGTTGTGYFLYANSEKVEMSATNTYSTYVKLDADKSELIIKFALESCSGNWISCDNVQLTYVGADFPAVTLVDGKMSAATAASQTSAKNAFDENQTVTNYNALLAAIAAAQNSKNAYTKTADALTNANALKDAHNFATAAATATFTDGIAAVQTAYDNATLSDEIAAKGGDLGTCLVGWHEVRAEANWTVAEAYMKDAWTGSEFNDWSEEGDTDGSNFHIPFFQHWVKDGESLGAATPSGTLTSLPNGQYKVSAWVRVRAKNGVAATDATGITMTVNNGDAVDVTEGTQIGESQFQIDTYEAVGLVKNGTLNVVMNIADGNNVSWLSFKNIKYTKLRDLTPEEAAVVPADLSLAATSTVYKGRTTTLTPTSTTDGASIEGFVNWSSDNEDVATVANGVVTGVAYGTANITVTSILNGEATATCAVTVTAPLITEAENLDFASGPVVENHIRTYAKDKTGTDVAQMQEVYGWTFGVANGDAKAAGVMAYGSSYGMGNNTSDLYAPATNPNGEATGNALGMVGVWTGSVQYVQNVKLPAGAYTITVPVYRNGGSSALTKNLIGVILDDATEHLATTKTYASGSWTTETIEFTITSETYGKLSIGLNAPNQGSGNSQRLWIDGMTITYEPFATAEEIAALNSAITTAEAKTLGFEDGEYAPYSNIEVLTTLANAKALDKENPVAQSVVTGATTILNNSWNQNVGDVDAIYNGLYATVTDGANYPKGWKRTNGWGQMRSGIEGVYATAYYNQPGSLQYGNQGLYTMPLAANTIYRLTFAYRSHENNSNYSMKASVLNEGSEGLSEIEFGGNGSTSDWKLVSQRFRTGAAGNYVLTLANGGNTWMTNVSLVKENSAANITINETVTFVPQADPLANVHLARAIKADKWNSIVLPFDVNNTDLKAAFGSDVQVAEFSETADGTSSTINFATMVTPAIEANKPVLLKTSTAGTEYDFTDRTIEVGEAKVTGNGNFNFIGTYDASFTVPANDYFISSNTLYKSKGTTTLKGTRAYLENLGATEVKMFIDDLETSINGLMADDEENGPVYNLAGQRVQKAQKGIFVKNGRKVVVR